MWKKYKPYILSSVIALAVGALSSLLTRGNMNIYQDINVPPLAPPMAIFPWVWAILFILMGISSAMVYLRRDDEDATSALQIYAIQLVVNFFWSIIFFNMRAFFFAFIWTMLLWTLIIIMIVQFRKVSKTAANLQYPYLIWVTFAAYLTLMIWLLNR